MDGSTADRLAKAKALSLLAAMALVALIVEAWPQRAVVRLLPAPVPLSVRAAPPGSLLLPGTAAPIVAVPLPERADRLPDTSVAVLSPVPDPMPPAQDRPRAPAVVVGPLELVAHGADLPALPAPPFSEAPSSIELVTASAESPPGPALTRGIIATGDAIKTAFRITGKSIVGIFARAF